jgi:hypothetical protein
VKLELRAMTKSHLIRESAVDDLLDHAVGEVLLLGVAAHVLEWHHRQRWLIRQRRHAALRKCGGIGARLCLDPCHRRGKAITAPRDRPDATPLRSAVIEDTAKRRDLHGQVAVLDHGSRPHRSHYLVLGDEIPWPLDQDTENLERA